MARSIDTIMTTMLDKKAELESLDPLTVLTTSEKNNIADLTSTSKVSLWRVLLYICAVSIWFLENLFDIFVKETEYLISQNQIGTPDWYRKKMLEFQLGFDLQETGNYDNTGVSTADLNASLIVKQAAVEELAGRLRLKAATETGGELAPLSAPQLAAFINYCEKFKYAGTYLTIISDVPDDLKADFTIYYNPLILDATGARLDGTSETPVQDAFNNFLRNLRFNGEMSVTSLVDALQQVEGVTEPVKNFISTKFGANPYAEIYEFYIANAGYMRLDIDETVFNFQPRAI